MPLQCTGPAGPELAFRHTQHTWEALRAKNAADRHLVLPCCGSAVVLKRSPRGTRFFAHTQRAGCTTAPETAEHLLLKDMIAKAAEESGWVAATEARGQTPSGEAWVADVLCTKPGTSAQVAFEVQWSAQAWEETQRRQKRYQDSGVRAVWLMRQTDMPSCKETPAFHMRFVKPDRPQVLLWSRRSSSGSAEGAKAPDPWDPPIDLREFVKGALEGRLQFSPLLTKSVKMSILAAPENCWRCEKLTWVALGFLPSIVWICPGEEPPAFTIEDAEKAGPVAWKWAQQQLDARVLKANGIGAIRPRYSKTLKREYLSNGCVHCGALQGQHFYARLYPRLTKVCELPVKLEPWMLSRVDNHLRLHRWWFFSDHPVAPTGPSTPKSGSDSAPALQQELFLPESS